MKRILLGGSPCTHWSIAQKNNRETEPDGIGWELFKNYLIAKEKFKPDIFLYENNKSAAQAIKEQISRELGAPLQYINSALVSAQNRQRFYVHNMDVPMPEDRRILLRDILESGIVDKEKAYCLKHQAGNARDYLKKHHTQVAFEPVIIQTPHGYNRGGIKRDKAPTLTANGSYQTNNHIIEPVCVAQRGRYADSGNRSVKTDGVIQQFYEAREDGKTNALTTVQKDNNVAIPVNDTDGKARTIKAQYYKNGIANFATNGGFDATCVAEPVRIGQIENDLQNQSYDSKQYRVYSPEGKSTTLCGNGGGVGAKTGLYAVSVDKDSPVYPIYEVKDGCITHNGKQYPIELHDGFYIIRKLTPVECERLQTLPDNYTAGISNSQRYKCLGNGWTAEVIIHILQYMNIPLDEELIVLSMYDGIATGRYCLEKLGYKNVKYYAYEIDKYAKTVALKNYPDIIQCGDAFDVRKENWEVNTCLQNVK